jgi:roadblock/LC7 domain-containing protein
MYKKSGTPRLSELMAGGNPLTGLKRLMSERDIDSKNVIKGLSDELGIDLEQYTLDNMAMAEVVTKMFGDKKQKSLFSQESGIGIDDVAGAAVTNGGNLLPRVVMGMVNVFRQSPEAALNKIISAPRQTALVKNLEIFKDMTPDSAKYAEVRKNISDELAVIQAKLDKTKSDEITREVQKQIDDFNNILALPSPSGQVSADVVNLKTIIPRQNRDALKGGTSTSRSLPESAESGLSPEAGIQTKSQPLGGSTKKQSKVSSSKDIIPKDSTKAKPSAKVGGMKNLETEAKKFKTADEFVTGQKSDFIHETDTDFTKFDKTKIKNNTGDSWLGDGFYAQKKGTFKLESYGDIKKEVYLDKGANIFDGKLVDYAGEKGLIEGKLLNRYTEDTLPKRYKLEEQMSKGRVAYIVWDSELGRSFSNAPYESKSNALDAVYKKVNNVKPDDLFNPTERDLFKKTSIEETLRKDGYDGVLTDSGELVVYNLDMLRTKQELTDIWNKANKK